MNALQLIAGAVARPIRFLNNYVLYTSRLRFAAARGAIGTATRNLDPEDPATWEFSAFSQNGEDGIIDQLMRLIPEPNRYFLEIGSSDGLENNTAYLAVVKRFSGIMVEGSRLRSTWSRTFLKPHCLGVDFLNRYVTSDSVPDLVSMCREKDPDFFSLDIDGMDFHVLKSFFDAGLRPKVLCLEYNSAFGPDQAVTIPYNPTFDFRAAHPSGIYYGVSLAGWRRFLESKGYEFVTVDSNGVNAFFADRRAVDMKFESLRRLEWRENVSQAVTFRCAWPGQFKLIENEALLEIDPRA